MPRPKKNKSVPVETPSRQLLAESRKARLLEDSESEEDIQSPTGEAGFKVNEAYARRFEHNKKREELHRCTYPMCARDLHLYVKLISFPAHSRRKVRPCKTTDSRR
jgi:hypothetical protein